MATLSASVSLTAIPAAHAGVFDQIFAGGSGRHHGHGNFPPPPKAPSRSNYGNSSSNVSSTSSSVATPVAVDKPEPARVHSYEPDKLVTVPLSDLADSVTTGSIDDIGNGSGDSSQSADNRTTDSAFLSARADLADMRLRALPEVAAAIKAHYASDPSFIWVSDGRVNEKAKAVLDVLANADTVGLDPADYAVSMPNRPTVSGMPNADGGQAGLQNASAIGGDADQSMSGMNDGGEGSFVTDPSGSSERGMGSGASSGSSREQALMRFEMELSRAALTYALDAHRGRVAPDRLSDYHDLPRKKVDLEAALDTMANDGNAARWLKRENPQGEQFVALKQALAKLREDGSRPVISLPSSLVIKVGQRDPNTSKVVAALRQNGSDDLHSKYADTLADYDGSDLYTRDISHMVRTFQKEQGLSADGVVGPNTVSALTGFSNANKIEKLKLSMERARWLPGVLPAERVFVNQAAYVADFYKDGKEAFKTKVIIGKKDHQTNFFSDEIETVEFNPYWGVPQSIMMNEMLPKLRRNSAYLDRMGYQLTYKGKDVSSTQFNWNQIGSMKSFAVRQPPGDDNALGRLKILFPNKHAIYLHDTPSQYLFKHSVRDFSHGCVRMHDPRGMAAEVLGISRDKVDQYIASGRNQAVDVKHKIPVFLAYFTAWPQNGGAVEYFDDVYGRDANLKEAISRTETTRRAQT
ncbi:L,D-transpeptidase family protein [Pararhizobium mangrovi]|uniref:L,D-transpeptidase family protein n=1 Tax=Pararhizobium mangrovi TaxID=2590452 RepID=UPI0015E84F40|nr:L,D-transpeptidase family protein [Pararhizobium mangrovi]